MVKFTRVFSAIKGLTGPLVAVRGVVTVFGHPELLDEGIAAKDLYRNNFCPWKRW